MTALDPRGGPAWAPWTPGLPEPELPDTVAMLPTTRDDLVVHRILAGFTTSIDPVALHSHLDVHPRRHDEAARWAG